MDPKTFRSWMERTGGVLDAREWEVLKACIEEREKEERIRQAKIKYGEMVETAVEMGRETNAGRDGEAIGRDMPTECDRADGKTVEKGRRGHRKSKCQKLPGEAKKRVFPSRKPHGKKRRK